LITIPWFDYCFNFEKLVPFTLVKSSRIGGHDYAAELRQ
jgi:hypothetical protein